jgi:fatty acid desaturase
MIAPAPTILDHVSPPFSPLDPHADQPDGTLLHAGSELRELRRRVQSAGLLAPQSRSFARALIITAALLAGCIIFLIFFHALWGVVLGALLLSVVSVQIAFLGHDAGHRQGFQRRWQNTLVGLVLSDVLLGASFGWWVRKHNAHHAHPNHADMDPDIDLPLIAFTPEQAMAKRGITRWIARHQVWFAVPLLSLVAYAQRVSSVLFVSRERSRYRRWEVAALLLNAVLYVGMPLVLLGPWLALVLIVVQQAVTGIYLGLVFAPNHKGMMFIDAETVLDPLRAQVLTARNVKGHLVTDWVYGGLNYQIEHHLFPSMARNRLGAAQRIVSAFCRERGIPYHETSVPRSYLEIMRALRAAAAPLQA